MGNERNSLYPFLDDWESITLQPDEIVYMHSGTEANNLAITGLAQAVGKRNKIIISFIEHLIGVSG